MNWTEYEERYGESREDFTERDYDRCSSCGSTEDVEERLYYKDGYRHTELVCAFCRNESLIEEE